MERPHGPWYRREPEQTEAMPRFVAEFWSAVSSLAIVAVGLRRNSPAVLVFGVASVAARAAPTRAVAAVTAVLWVPSAAMLVLRLSAAPDVLASHHVQVTGAVAVGALALGRYLESVYPESVQARVPWHVALALMLDCLERESAADVLV